MNFYYINSLDELMEGYFGILEPTSNNKIEDFNNAVSITPGICFSYDLYRIGYGKGYYDKFYSNHGVYKIGLCYSNCLIDKKPRHYVLNAIANKLLRIVSGSAFIPL